MLINNRSQLVSVIKEIADKLDIPREVYENAVSKYEDVSEHLTDKNSNIANYSPKVYVQGSFRLGTVVRPLNTDGEYDIDLVCCLESKKESISQDDLRSIVGMRLKARADLAQILKASRRCWTLEYPKESAIPSFHMDILPSIPNEEKPPTGILLADTERTKWQRSNPIAYAEWFKSRMEVIFHTEKIALASAMKAVDIDDVPDWKVRTPLQRCIQILKRHRDIYFYDNQDIQPVSIIINTLAGHAYNNEADIYDVLYLLVQKMPKYIENRNGLWWVQNPVDEDENFADKWNEDTERYRAFLQWLNKIKKDFTEVSQAANAQEGIALLNQSIGEETMDKVADSLEIKKIAFQPFLPAITVPVLGNDTHALNPEKEFRIKEITNCKVRIIGSVHRTHYGKKLCPLSSRPVQKKIWLKFTVETNAPNPYSVRWQVTNTGSEAKVANQLRGDFYESEKSLEGVRWETTAYLGTHWVRAFILDKNGICIASSRKLFVRIR